MDKNRLSPDKKCRCDSSLVIDEWRATRLPWPAKGADINPIENVWGDKVKDSAYFLPRTDDEVFQKAHSIWERYRCSLNYWRKLVYSTIRLLLVVENEGSWTKYLIKSQTVQ